MGALLKLMGRQPQTQALIKAPSMDLIRSDNEFVPPEPREIELELEPGKLAGYAQTAKDLGFGNEAISREKLLHILKTKNFRIYDRTKVNDFMKLYRQYACKNLKLGDDLWWQWVNLKKYRHPLPPRVVENIKAIHSSYPPRSRYHDDKEVIFFVSDIVLITNRHNGASYKNTEVTTSDRWEIIPMKRKTEICFLNIAASTDSLLEESLIIDAWRGPTFSDEEACLP